MNIILAESAGFCFGVKRAVSMVEEQIKLHPDLKIYTYGPIIHNENVVEDFRKQGVEVMAEDSDPKSYEKGIVILRTHGVSKKVQN